MEERSIDTLPLDGGWLCLNFINTVHDRTVEEPFEYLSSFSNFLDWAVKVEVLASGERDELAEASRANKQLDDQTYQHIIEARTILYDLFRPIARNETPNPKTQTAFNRLLEEAMSQLELQIENKLAVHQQWKNRSDLKYPLYPIIKSAYDILTSDKLDRVKECGACGWLFLDQSKNRSRKWCSMESCGSNVKAKRYYHRNKKKMDDRT